MDESRVPLKYRVSRPLMQWICRSLFCILARVKITGRENVPVGKPYIAAINHISLYDPPLAIAFWPEPPEILGASDVFDRPGQGQLARLYGVWPVHRGEYDRAALEWTVRVIRAGRPLLIAPEGGRSHATAMRRAQPGVGYIMDVTRVPVVPAAITGTTDDFWERARRGKRPFLEMRIGKPVELPAITEKGAARHELRQLNADLVMRHIAGMLPPDYRGVYAESAIPPA